MKTNPEKSKKLAEEIAQTEEKLHDLEREIAAIGAPATHALQKRLDALKIEEHALQRNFHTALEEEDDEQRMEKVETLLHHIEHEEASVQHEADFLRLGAPSSVSLAAKGGARLYELGTRGFKRIGAHLWHSPFVNRTHDGIMAKFGNE